MPRPPGAYTKAAAEGHMFYRTGVPCIRGHVDWRWVVSRACCACHREDSRKEAKIANAKRKLGYAKRGVRLAARAAGEKLYTTGYKCRRGHTAPRYTRSGHCSACEGIAHPFQNLSPRNVAKIEGLKYYRTNKPCIHGHNGWRMTVNGNCVECLNDRANRYKAEKRAALALECV